jgi:hypothetical protein
MTQMTARRTRTRLLARARTQIARKQRKVSDRVHQAADRDARARGWTVTPATGRLGFSGRTYRDPRFDQRHRRLNRTPSQNLTPQPPPNQPPAMPGPNQSQNRHARKATP